MELNDIYINIQQMYNIYGRKYGLMNPRFIKNDNGQITWLIHISNEKFETYEEYYLWVNENLQYSFSLEDDSLIQIFFEGKRQGKKIPVKKGSMAYLPSPYSYSEYFRFDVDLDNEKDYAHPTYHAHFGYRAKDVRFTLFKYPMPTEFLKLIQFLHHEVPIEQYAKEKFWETLADRNIKFNHCLDFK